jgi:hypothetical protein
MEPPHVNIFMSEITQHLLQNILLLSIKWIAAAKEKDCFGYKPSPGPVIELHLPA